MARVSVVDPYSGVVLDVDEDSPQAKAWRRDVAADVVEAHAPSVKGEPDKRKPGRPRKAE